MDEDPDADMLDVGSPTLISSSSVYIPSAANLKVLNFIETTFDNIIAGLEVERPPFGEVAVHLMRITRSKSRAKRHDRSGAELNAGSSGDDESSTKIRSRQVRYSWPGDTAKEAERFAYLLAILGEIRSAILSGVVVTKRDIYYHQPELFGKQEVVDRWIDDIAFTCGVTRKDLMVTASPKGLVCGLCVEERVQSVPMNFDEITGEDVRHLNWILVVEKEASFKTLVESNFDQACALGVGMLVTAKGYPDLQTRSFLRHVLNISALLSPIPIFGLFDGDPDGLEILRCYKSGSDALAQEAIYNLPEVKWLGVDVCEFLGNPQVMNEAVALTSRDRNRAKGMLSRIHVRDASAQTASTKRMLQMMLMLGKKMEIQALSKIDGGLCGWLEKAVTVA
ncbi:endodeoxyribonuclease [Lithohypha guttulata]|uniref:DNA topoisomerase (ATP-hydrolyzing) n=1 Tax=Lithohypha guttulata TaxID=1690604 RepID=A0AAN7T2W8_9EURO|nr:endodeoxyribonuclease [Lithohypha guttulata]KAK5087812.1 endodeoxyribonuclease [Lithohypha guttulata]KAK5095444.1 endodeoxyribonuclease [Lithohypha guttulata]